MMKSEKQYIEFYQEASSIIKERSCPVMNAVRDAAFRQFESSGFPTRKVERYRYTDVDTVFAPNYGISLTPITITPSPFIFHLKDAPIDVSPYYNRVANTKDSITALNTMLSHDALLIYVPPYTKVESPIAIDNWLRGKEDTMMNRRFLIILDKGAEATIIISDRMAPPSQAIDHHLSEASPLLEKSEKRKYLTTQVIEVCCHDNAHLDLYEIEETTSLCSRFSNVYIKVGRDSSVRYNSITLFNGLTRNLCDVYLTDTNSQVTLNGCAIGSANQHIDNNTLIHHQAPSCQSNQLYKYVVDDQAVGAFAGKILVEKGAQQTTSQETNANLCASSEARIYTQPMLEIYADDVKCAHGSTVGVMDESALFYMRQRGIPEAEARTLLKNAFMGQVINSIQYEPLRQKLYVKVEKRFRGELDKCEDCRLCK